MSDPTTEGAKALQEIAKATGKGIDAAREAGGFIAKYVHGPLEQAMGIWTDKLKYTRWERQVTFMHRANAKLDELGLSEPTHALPLKIAIPILQEGSMEEEDYLQDRWANLLVNASSGLEVRATYISMLRDMTSMDVQILALIYAHPEVQGRSQVVFIDDLPATARLVEPGEDIKPGPPALPKEVALSVENLVRLGCIAEVHGFAGSIHLRYKAPTVLGRGFITACTLKRS
ncbi:hypothetical protein [Polaromonas sp.]|uniref:Abi-alpha family protein n=1 Tax=Polaromonas sp. TaxID=1869339 RepID=UPI003BACAE74